jgi:hypothetical protein
VQNCSREFLVNFTMTRGASRAGVVHIHRMCIERCGIYHSGMGMTLALTLEPCTIY